ncbi:MAG TPA: DNA polymerase III subunit beta [Bacteroidetes bacterium]|nr:DNA polymerase III subunit beta [Bacteroidota bacterium]
MNFIVSSSALLKHLSKISGVIPSRSVLPIIENFLFEIEEGNLSISTTNLEISMQTSLNIESRGGTIKIAVPAKILLDILKALPEQPITFSITEDTFSIEISSENGKYKLSGEDGLDFPKIPSPEDTRSTSMPVNVLLTAINRTLFAASTDEDKAALNGIFFKLGTDALTFVATDAHRLVRYRRVDITVETPASFIVPQKALNLVKSSFDNSDEPIKIEYNDSNAFFSTNSLLLVCRLIDQKYPDYENVIPTENPNRLTISRLDLLGTLQRVNIFANKTSHQVRFKASGSELNISSEDLDYANEARESLKCHYEGGDIEIGFNASLLIDIVKNATTDEVLVELSTPNRAGIILPNVQDEGEDLLMLIMPVMLNSYNS